MPVLLANNAAGRLAGSINDTDQQISLRPGEGARFPAPDPGYWFPLTIVNAYGAMEVLKATARTGDVISVARGQEGSPAMSFSAGDRVELRLTTLALTELVDSVRLAFTPVQQGGGAGQAGNKVYIGWSGSGLKAQIDGLDYGTLWSTHNLNPAAYMPLTGGNFTGNFGIYNTSPTVMFYDTDWGPRQLHCNSGLIGFLNSGGGWACYSDDAGNFIATANVAAYSDIKHKKRIRTIAGGLDLVEKLRGVRYARKRDGRECVGVIAQEVQAVLPEVVMETPDGLSVDYGNLAAPMLEAIKELAARVRKLEC